MRYRLVVQVSKKLKLWHSEMTEFNSKFKFAGVFFKLDSFFLFLKFACHSLTWYFGLECEVGFLLEYKKTTTNKFKNSLKQK